MKEELIYSLNLEDIQTVSRQTLERELTPEEIAKIIEIVPERINWYDAIETAILETIPE